MSDVDVPRSSRDRLTEIRMETSDADLIRRLVLALISEGFRVETVWQQDATYLDVYLGGSQ